MCGTETSERAKATAAATAPRWRRAPLVVAFAVGSTLLATTGEAHAARRPPVIRSVDGCGALRGPDVGACQRCLRDGQGDHAFEPQQRASQRCVLVLAKPEPGAVLKARHCAAERTATARADCGRCLSRRPRHAWVAVAAPGTQCQLLAPHRPSAAVAGADTEVACAKIRSRGLAASCRRCVARVLPHRFFARARAGQERCRPVMPYEDAPLRVVRPSGCEQAPGKRGPRGCRSCLVGARGPRTDRVWVFAGKRGTRCEVLKPGDPSDGQRAKPAPPPRSPPRRLRPPDAR